MIGGAKGIGIGIDFGIPNQYCRATSKPYIEKDVLDSLRVVASAYGKSNDDADRSIVKNLVDASNPFIISNAAFKLNSGFGKYSADFESFDWAVNISQKQHNKATISLNGRLCNHAAIEVDEMKVNIIGNVTELIYWYIANPDDTTRSEIRLTSGINTLPKSYAKDDGQTYNIGFAYISGDSEITIEQIPSFEGAFVTDGIDDLITSTKTVQEMLRGSSEYTVLSMIHHIDVPEGNIHSNTVRIKLGSWGTSNRITSFSNNKTGIYGYTVKNQNITVINNILGDKNDYGIIGGDYTSNLEAKFSVVGWIGEDDILRETASIAWYWTIIANKVLTTDQINQVIAYFNLDRTLKPDILCNVKKQGITNENHAEFGDRLIDFSGNGRDIQLNNIAWKGDSGIGKYEVDFSTWITGSSIDVVNKTSELFHITNNTDAKRTALSYNLTPGNSDIKEYKIKVEIIKGTGGEYKYYNEEGKIKYFTLNESKIYTLPTSHNSILTTAEFNAFIINPNSSYKVIQIPSHAGALCLDGVNDFGKVTGMPVYKDYTFIIDRQIISIGDTAGIVASKSEDSTDVNKQGAFLFEYLGAPNNISAWSFYKDNGKVANTDFTRGISYQSTYSYNGKDLTVGTSKDSDKLWLGTIRDRDSRFFNGAIYSLMSFPYSMSEFLIERQLKKHKLGTLYPDMVEFRPIVKSNIPYSSITYSVNPGEYISVDSMVTITVTLPNTSDKLMEVSCNAISDISISGDNGVYEITGKIVKSPQKINIVISSYLTMLSNSTLISNETLIKNE
jgi:hypothetical protein